MSLINFNSSEPKRSGEKKSLKILLGIGALVGTIAIGSTLAASINLNGSNPVEFGQGVAQTTACDSGVEVTPNSTFVNSEGGGNFKFTKITLSNLDGTSQTDASDEGCASKTFTIKTYDSDGFLIQPSYEISLDANGNFSSLSGDTDGTDEGSTDSSVTLTFFGGILKSAESVYRITIESSGGTAQSISQNRITAGSSHSCVILESGGVECWGGNSSGQLGDGSEIDRTSPVAVSGLSSGVTAIAAGGFHTCALLESGAVNCWGYSLFGQVGDGNQSRSTPVEVSGLSSGVTAIATGTHHSCALLESGAVKCWGLNGYGQLGDESNNNSRSIPELVSGLSSGVKAIAAGSYHTCAVLNSGAVKCWGWNVDGQLGDGTFDDHSTPVAVDGLNSGVKAITAGDYHTCALLNSGAIKCWGLDDFGQLGDGGENINSSTPVSVSGLTSGVVAIGAGGRHNCALLDSGAVQCWGFNGYGQLGDGTSANHPAPYDVYGLSSGVVAIAAGDYHTCALLNSGDVNCWGDNTYGELGDGTLENRLTPVEVVRPT